ERHYKVEELLKEYDNVCTLRVRMSISSDFNQKHMNSRSTSESEILYAFFVLLYFLKQW
ncbi:hypothetical protein Tco_1034670, partial [Tanacetum coccineum]